MSFSSFRSFRSHCFDLSHSSPTSTSSSCDGRTDKKERQNKTCIEIKEFVLRHEQREIGILVKTKRKGRKCKMKENRTDFVGLKSRSADGLIRKTFSLIPFLSRWERRKRERKRSRVKEYWELLLGTTEQHKQNQRNEPWRAFPFFSWCNGKEKETKSLLPLFFLASRFLHSHSFYFADTTTKSM